MRLANHFASRLEDHPRLPGGTGERVSGYGVMGLPFSSGHLLGLRRWTASSVGDGFTSIWHRDPAGRWTFYETVIPQLGCSRYFGADVGNFVVGPIDLQWESSNSLHVRTRDGAIDWMINLGSTVMTRLISMLGVLTPPPVWRSRAVLTMMGAVAGRALDAGKIQLTGRTSNDQHFDANPQRIWTVTDSHALVRGTDVGSPAPLINQAHMADFYFPQRGIFAVGRVFVTDGQDERSSCLSVANSRVSFTR